MLGVWPKYKDCGVKVVIISQESELECMCVVVQSCVLYKVYLARTADV